jgi:hypothetical protein
MVPCIQVFMLQQQPPGMLCSSMRVTSSVGVFMQVVQQAGAKRVEAVYHQLGPRAAHWATTVLMSRHQDKDNAGLLLCRHSCSAVGVGDPSRGG